VNSIPYGFAYIVLIDVRVGPETISDPSFMVARSMEDFVTWVDTSKIRRKVLNYNDKVWTRNVVENIRDSEQCITNELIYFGIVG
jgi:ribosomal protein S4